MSGLLTISQSATGSVGLLMVPCPAMGAQIGQIIWYDYRLRCYNINYYWLQKLLRKISGNNENGRWQEGKRLEAGTCETLVKPQCGNVRALKAEHADGCVLTSSVQPCITTDAVPVSTSCSRRCMCVLALWVKSPRWSWHAWQMGSFTKNVYITIHNKWIHAPNHLAIRRNHCFLEK